MRAISELIKSGGVFTLEERFEIWESRPDANVLEDFPIGELSEERYHEVMDKLKIPRSIIVIDDEIILLY